MLSYDEALEIAYNIEKNSPYWNSRPGAHILKEPVDHEDFYTEDGTEFFSFGFGWSDIPNYSTSNGAYDLPDNSDEYWSVVNKETGECRRVNDEQYQELTEFYELKNPVYYT